MRYAGAMGPGHFVLFINIAVAALFACAYIALALTISGQRKALWFAYAYCVGLAKPASDALLSVSAYPQAMECVGYAGFLAAMLLMSPALNIFHDRPAGWRLPMAILCGGLALRIAIFAIDRTSLLHGLAYQLPFAAAALLGCWTVWQLALHNRTAMVLGGLFAVLAAQFVAKPWIAVQVGAGQQLQDYVTSRYALISQVSTGIVLIAVGLTLLMLVVQRAIAASTALAESDPLSGLLNRRGFDRRATALLAGQDVVALLIDLDHFKRINDNFGHAVGDRVLIDFARRLRAVAPDGAILGRLGGEEFAVLCPGSVDDGRALADALRAPDSRADDSIPAVTASVGVAAACRGGSLAALLRSADDATYSAKRAGRDCVMLSEPEKLAA